MCYNTYNYYWNRDRKRSVRTGNRSTRCFPLDCYYCDRYCRHTQHEKIRDFQSCGKKPLYLCQSQDWTDELTGEEVIICDMCYLARVDKAYDDIFAKRGYTVK